jgi:hypothetical protein
LTQASPTMTLGAPKKSATTDGKSTFPVGGKTAFHQENEALAGGRKKFMCKI